MRKEFKSLVSVILFIVILLLGYFFVYPQWKKLSSNRTELGQLRQQNEELKKQTQEIANFINSFKGFEEEKAAADEVLPVKSDKIDSAVRQLNTFAETSNLHISTLTVNPVPLERRVTENGIEAVSFNLSLTGSYPSFNYFLQLLHQNLRLFDVLSVDFRSAGAGETLQFMVRVQTYYQR